ncbi:hypothetical protein CRG98_013794 [Punica granatum]|uniref:Uncharacterized protein n=1 Tax=Punica granatum TaxID=22663 RepID=A0A2I0KCA9_PUNGR|nr:hypothetical protein CRG98_013794 [Punica granatum]
MPAGHGRFPRPRSHRRWPQLSMAGPELERVRDREKSRDGSGRLRPRDRDRRRDDWVDTRGQDSSRVGLRPDDPRRETQPRDLSQVATATSTRNRGYRGHDSGWFGSGPPGLELRLVSVAREARPLPCPRPTCLSAASFSRWQQPSAGQRLPAATRCPKTIALMTLMIFHVSHDELVK